MSAIVASRVIKRSAGSGGIFTLETARTKFRELEAWLLSDKALALPLSQVEVAQEQRSREVQRLMLQAHLERRGSGNVGPLLEVREKGDRVIHRLAREDARQIVSIFGAVQAKRSAYAARGRESVHPLDEELEVGKRSFTYEVQKRMIHEVVRGPYEEAMASVERNTGNRIPKRSLEQVTEEASEDFEAFYARRRGARGKSTGPILVAAVDGKGVPMVKKEGAKRTARRRKGEKANKKKMATVAAVFTQKRRIRTPEEVVASLFEGKSHGKSSRTPPEHKRVWASLCRTKEDVIEEVAAEMVARDPNHDKQRVVVADGERALQQRVRKSMAAVLLVLDFLHVLEYLWKAAYALHAEGSREATRWVQRHALMLLQGDASQVVKGMRQSATKRRLRGSKRKAVLGAAAYLYRNRPYMRYDEYLRDGLPIASGAVEGACKNLVKDRMERSGMRWTISGAEAVLKLRAICLSGDWDAYWRYHIKAVQCRLYRWRRWKPAA